MVLLVTGPEQVCCMTVLSSRQVLHALPHLLANELQARFIQNSCTVNYLGSTYNTDQNNTWIILYVRLLYFDKQNQ